MTAIADAPSAPRGDVYERRTWRRSAWIALACFGAGVVMFSLQISNLEDLHGKPLSSHSDAILTLDFFVGLLSIVVVGPMHKAGRWNYLLIGLTSVSTMGTAAAAVALIRLGTRRSKRDDCLGVVLFVAAGLFNSWIVQDPHFQAELLLAIPILAAVAFGFLSWGHSRADRAALVESLRREADAARREKVALERSHAAMALTHQADAARVRAEERSALARDMHDSLSHHLSLIAMHAGALAYRTDLNPEQVRAAAQTLRDAAGNANAELAFLLSTLREQNTPRRDTDPLPVGERIDDLVTSARARGQKIDFAYERMDSSDIDALNGATRAALHRIVGELLLNAHKYSPQEAVTMRIGHDDRQLVIRTSNPLRPRLAGGEPLGTGMGIVGIRERVRLLSGQFSLTDHDGYFTVEVRIPWPTR